MCKRQYNKYKDLTRVHSLESTVYSLQPSSRTEPRRYKVKPRGCVKCQVGER